MNKFFRLLSLSALCLVFVIAIYLIPRSQTERPKSAKILPAAVNQPPHTPTSPQAVHDAQTISEPQLSEPIKPVKVYKPQISSISPTASPKIILSHSLDENEKRELQQVITSKIKNDSQTQISSVRPSSGDNVWMRQDSLDATGNRYVLGTMDNDGRFKLDQSLSVASQVSLSTGSTFGFYQEKPKPGASYFKTNSGEVIAKRVDSQGKVTITRSK